MDALLTLTVRCSTDSSLRMPWVWWQRQVDAWASLVSQPHLFGDPGSVRKEPYLKSRRGDSSWGMTSEMDHWPLHLYMHPLTPPPRHTQTRIWCTHTDTHRHKYRHRHAHTKTHIDRHTDTQTERHIHRHTETDKHRHTHTCLWCIHTD